MSQNWHQDFWILEIINYRRVKNLIVSREAILSEILVTIEHTVLLRHSKYILEMR